ncbi:type III secretion system outer membrane protein SpiA precursor [bacterium BMS3Abin03]|nr:type III secretion system outer membrane protein SpiA precursor [bacterium BMS3Abin03]
MKTIITYFVLSLFLVIQIFPQKYWERRFKTYNNPDELVTMAETLPFNQAIELLSKVSESTTGKKIVSTVQRTDPIGVEINSMPYDKALLIIVQYANLMYEEKEDLIVVKSKKKEEERTADTYASIDQREVKISAVFFEMDVQKSKKLGIDWKVLLSGNQSDLSGLMRTEAENSKSGGTGGSTGGSGSSTSGLQPEFNLGASTNFNVGGFFGQATALFKAFEEDGIGEIIASPSIVVRDKSQGTIQVGSDFSVRTRDFAGNTVEKFFPTGTIIDVTPYIYNEEGINYVLLDITVERSSFSTNETTTEIRKTNASTQVVMLDGEETVLGGLFVNEETKTRNGIPFLKDLPWWVFGIRYITGSDATVERKKELIILLKAELIPTLKERFAHPDTKNLIHTQVDKNQKRVKYYKIKESSINGKN